MKRHKTKRLKTAQPRRPARKEIESTSREGIVQEDERRRGRPRPNESVEDPLQDWPESSGEPDQWLDERRTPNGNLES